MERVSRITILHDGTSPAVEDVAGALVASGLEASLLEAKDDLNAVVRGIGERGADLVFNLVETFAGNVRLRPDIAAALDLVGVPYTGAGPSGLHLAGAPELAQRLLTCHGVGTKARASVRVAVVGNDRLAVFPRGESLAPIVAGAFAALRLRDYALVELALEPEPAIVRAVANPALGRKDPMASIAAEAGLTYEDLILSIADEAWDRHKEVAVAVKSA